MFTSTIKEWVLILILVEDSRRHAVKKRNYGIIRGVLILILVEDSRRQTLFNLKSNGIGVLILILVEDSRRQTLR